MLLDLLLKNWVAKLGSLLSALMLFWYVQANRTIARDIQVRVEPMKLPGGLVYASRVPAYMNVQLRGPRELMDFPISDLKIRLFSEKPRAEQRVTFQTLLPTRLPAGVEARYAKRVFLDVDRELTRELPVEPLYNTNRLPPRLRAGYSTIEPATLTVRGPARFVQKLTKIQTRELEVRAEGPGMFEAYAYPTGIPDLSELAEGQPYELRFRMAILPKEAPTIDGQQLVSIEGLRARCSNGFAAYDIEMEPVNALVSVPRGRAQPRARQFEALFHCPSDPKTGEPLPLENVPVRISDRRDRKYVTILSATPMKTSLRFKRTARSLTQKARNEFVKPKGQ